MTNYIITKQAKFILNLFGQNGIFIDVGAYDGLEGSNTYLLENYGWDGICIEPNPISFNRLTQNRKCKCLNIALSDMDDFKEFISINGYAEQISCIYNTAPEEHLKRIENEISLWGGQQNKIAIQCKTFNSVIDIVDIEYVSIDAECHELNILKGTDFKKYNIKVISYENNGYSIDQCEEFLLNHGFEYLTTIDIDKFYKNKTFKIENLNVLTS